MENTPHVRGSLPRAVEDRIRAMMLRMGLVFGCFDFIRTPDDDIVFLEVNSNGQWGWVEEFTGLPLTDYFTEMLIHARPDYPAPESGPRLHIPSFRNAGDASRAVATRQS